MNEKLYLFNPFNIKNVENKELQKMYSEVFKQLIEDPNSMYEYSHNVEVYSNLNYIIGEVIARLTKDVLELKTKIKIDVAKNMVSQRKKWGEFSKDKPPAMTYFEAVATEISQKDINGLADKECSLARFKNAYKSIEEKINALKRKLESIKYEEFNN